jgi:hypothetical protein
MLYFIGGGSSPIKGRFLPHLKPLDINEKLGLIFV